MIVSLEDYSRQRIVSLLRENAVLAKKVGVYEQYIYEIADILDSSDDPLEELDECLDRLLAEFDEDEKK